CFGARRDLDVPMCSPCEDSYRASRRWRTIVTLVGVVVLVLAGRAALPLLDGGWRNLLIAGLVLLALAPPILWKAMAPFPLDLVQTRDELQLDFREETVAAECAQLNDGEVLRR
ncbi:MAG: hypothetical protein AAF581_20900, partial [Planctomycetota bacterium]